MWFNIIIIIKLSYFVGLTFVSLQCSANKWPIFSFVAYDIFVWTAGVCLFYLDRSNGGTNLADVKRRTNAATVRFTEYIIQSIQGNLNCFILQLILKHFILKEHSCSCWSVQIIWCLYFDINKLINLISLIFALFSCGLTFIEDEICLF